MQTSVIKLTQNFSIAEMTYSKTAKRLGISNVPSFAIINNLRALCEKVLQPARTALGIPLTITSGYRSQQLNKAVNGASASQHMNGEAADIVCADNAKLYHFIKDNLVFDQLIWEKGNNKQPAWVHVSFSRQNRKQILKM